MASGRLPAHRLRLAQLVIVEGLPALGHRFCARRRLLDSLQEALPFGRPLAGAMLQPPGYLGTTAVLAFWSSRSLEPAASSAAQ